MICPKCKSKVSNEDAVCPKCKLRLIFECPRCSSPTRLGSVNCKKCGYTFVKFCPNCHSANYNTSSQCRKCGYEFDVEENIEENKKEELQSETSIKEEIKDEIQQNPKQETKIPEIKKQNPQTSQKEALQEEEKPLICYIDFINLERIFEKYNKTEFKQKVVQNIKTTVKIVFSQTCEFIDTGIIFFKLHYTKSTKILDKINHFEKEFNKFNQILNRTLNCDLSFKFAITTMNEAEKDEIPQLKLGSDKDIIVSSGAYAKLSSELSLIKISSDSYKLLFLDQKPVFEQKEDKTYEKALEIALDNLMDNNSDIRAISINAPRGSGKTHLLNDLFYKISKVKEKNTIIFYAQCSALTQISPYGLIQNFFTSFFNCPAILKEEFNIKAFEKVVLEKLGLEAIDPENLETLANLIYPIKKDYFENILINKEITLKYLKDIFDYVKQKNNVVFIIDDFDLVDESSYAFLKYLVNKNYFERGAKMILSYKNQHSIAIYFQSNKFNNNNCLNISLKQLNIAECKELIKKILGQNCEISSSILSEIANHAQGNITYIEQVLQYLFERKFLVFENKVVKFKQEQEADIPETLEKCLTDRLNFLKDQNEKEYKFLTVASLLGDRVDYGTLVNIFDLEDDEFFEIVKKLDKKGYLKRKVDDAYGFKNSLTWSYCYIRAKEEKLIKKEAQKLLDELSSKIISTPLICPILAQITNKKELAFELWTQNLQYASYIGDVNIYTMAQKQSLILLESVKIDNVEYIKNNICERLGKLIYNKMPLEAKDYLTSAVLSAQKQVNINKIIDLSGYLVKSLYLIQDYTGVVEIVDNVLKYFNTKEKGEKISELELQSALIKTKKLKALLNLGSWEEIASIVDTELNPVLQKNLKSFKKYKWITQNEIFYSWIESNIILAQSYCEQGSPLAFELIGDINKVLSKEKGGKIDNLKVQLAYASAAANTSRGYFDESDAVLQEILIDYSYVLDSPTLVSKWNLINIINKILKMDYKTIKDDLFEATAYANNCSDEVSKNMLKTLLAYVLMEEKSYLKAIEIATSQMQYFSTKKLAFGALLAWYITAAATASNKADSQSIKICEKAVEICENAQNNNYYFKILFQELLAKCYLKMDDKENAQMYCDQALQSAYTNELLYLQIRLCVLKAQIAREKLTSLPANKKYDYAQNIIRMYNRTIEMAKKLNLNAYIKKIEKELTAFKAHCQLKNYRG